MQCARCVKSCPRTVVSSLWAKPPLTPAKLRLFSCLCSLRSGNLQLSFGVCELQVLMPSIDLPKKGINWNGKLETRKVGVISRDHRERQVWVYRVQRPRRLVVGRKLFRTHLHRRWSLDCQVRSHSPRGFVGMLYQQELEVSVNYHSTPNFVSQVSALSRTR